MSATKIFMRSVSPTMFSGTPMADRTIASNYERKEKMM
jgi:hypothetical protein